MRHQGQVCRPVSVASFVACVMVALTAIACTSPASQGNPVLLTYQAGSGTDALEVRGTLDLRNECIGLRSESNMQGAFWGLLWPEGVTVAQTSTGRWVVRTSDDKVVGRVGDRIRLEGSPLNMKDASDLATDGIPSDCAGDRYLAVSRVMMD
jgi:hypothetical protein